MIRDPKEFKMNQTLWNLLLIHARKRSIGHKQNGNSKTIIIHLFACMHQQLCFLKLKNVIDNKQLENVVILLKKGLKSIVREHK